MGFVKGKEKTADITSNFEVGKILRVNKTIFNQNGFITRRTKVRIVEVKIIRKIVYLKVQELKSNEIFDVTDEDILEKRKLLKTLDEWADYYYFFMIICLLGLIVGRFLKMTVMSGFFSFMFLVNLAISIFLIIFNEKRDMMKQWREQRKRL